MPKATLLAAALLLAPVSALGQQAPGSQGTGSPPRPPAPPAYQAGGTEPAQTGIDLLERLAQSELRERVAAAIETVEDACGADIERYCGEVTPGQGRIAMCMEAYADQLSRRCRVALFRVSRNIRQSVANLADECWNGIKAQCGTAEKIGECAVQKSASFSPACQTVIAALRYAGQRVAASLKDMPVYSADGTDLGRVVEAVRGPDGKVQAIQVQVGRFLGLGDKVVTISVGQFEELADRIRLRMNGEQVRALPETRRSGG